MPNLTEPHGNITETISTAIAASLYALDYDEGYALENITISGGSAQLTDDTQDGYLITPAFTIPKLASYVSVTVTHSAGAAPAARIRTDYEDEYRLVADTANLSINGNTVWFYIPFVAGAGTILSQINLTYAIAWAAPTDLDQFSYLDDETSLVEPFTDLEKRTAINYAHSRIIFSLQDAFNGHYEEHLTIPSLDILKKTECLYALAEMYGRKADQLLNKLQTAESFAVGSVSIQPADDERKDFYLHYLRLADRYEAKANKLLDLVLPPGTGDNKSTFGYEKGVAIADDYS